MIPLRSDNPQDTQPDSIMSDPSVIGDKATPTKNHFQVLDTELETQHEKRTGKEIMIIPDALQEHGGNKVGVLNTHVDIPTVVSGYLSDGAGFKQRSSGLPSNLSDHSQPASKHSLSDSDQHEVNDKSRVQMQESDHLIKTPSLTSEEQSPSHNLALIPLRKSRGRPPKPLKQKSSLVSKCQ